MRQLIIARKDLQMSAGKLAAQCCHASLAFISGAIQDNIKQITDYRHPAWEHFPEATDDSKRRPQLYRRPDLNKWSKEARDRGEEFFYAKPVNPDEPYGELELCEESYHYEANLLIDNDIYEQWFNGIYTKTICEAKNKSQLLKAKTMAEELGLVEGKDFFLIKDHCLTELEPEEIDETGVGIVLTCIGFRPLPDDIIQKISKRFQLYK